MPEPQSLRIQLLRRLIWPLLIVVLLDVAVSYFVALHFANLTYDRWLLDSARSLAQQVKSYKDQVTFELPPIAVEVFRWDATDKTFFKIESQEKGFMAGDRTLPSPAIHAMGVQQPYYADSLMQGEPIRVVSVLTTPGTSDESVMVSVAETLRKRRGLADEIILAVALPQLLLIVITLLHVWTSIRQGLRPLDDLTRLIARRSARELTPISDAGVPLEVRSLTHTINALLERLASAMAAQRRFIENAAHQLRTPLAGLKLQAERATRADNLETMQPALAYIRHAADRVARLSTQLLVLARSESSSQGSPELQALDLVELARDACVEWAPKALERGMDLAFEGTAETLTIAGEPTLLRELLNNLFDNALRYGRAGGTTVVAVSGHPDITLSVEDDGPGMSLDEAGRATERFYRIPGSPGDGCGLGLAIVKEIADLHQARLRIGGAAAGGTRIELTFPKQTPNLPEARPERRAPG